VSDGGVDGKSVNNVHVLDTGLFRVSLFIGWLWLRAQLIHML
jgi:hypothetical protein